jgi:hypothetical protein
LRAPLDSIAAPKICTKITKGSFTRAWKYVDIKLAFQLRDYKPLRVSVRVARWFIFKPKNPIWVNFGGS